VRGKTAKSYLLAKFACQFLKNPRQHAFAIGKDIRISETQDAIALRRYVRVPYGIPCTFGMLATVKFDGQLRLAAKKVDNIRANRRLADKFETDKPAIPKVPHSTFRIGHLPA
jgi:hypothetical protein